MFKYPLEVAHRQIVHMHETAVTAWVTEQNEQLVLYAHVNAEDPGRPVPRIFQVVTTGDEYESYGKMFIGACTLGNWFQAFVFEVVAEQDFPQNPAPEDVLDRRHDDDFKQIRQELQRELPQEVR